MKTWKILEESPLIVLLKDSEEKSDYTPASGQSWQTAYDAFAEQIAVFLEQDYPLRDVLHAFFYIRVELHALQRGSCYKAGKKCSLSPVSD